MNNERQNLPSASSAHRYAVCPGSFLAEQSISEDPSKDAEFGNRVHAALAMEMDPSDLSAAEESVFTRAKEFDGRAISDWLERIGGIGGEIHTFREVRIWYRDAMFRKLWSGKPDLILRSGTKALILDYKTLWGEHVPAPSNMQLRALVVLLAHEYVLDEVTVALVQTNKWPAITTAVYSIADIEQAEAEVAPMMERVKQPGQPRTATAEGCKYCRAKATCPAALGVVEALPAMVPRESREIAMSPEDIARFLDIAPVAEGVIESVRAKAKRMLEFGESIPGWRLKAGTVRETITKPETVFARFSEAGGTTDSFMGAISVTKTKLRAAVKAATGTKGRELDAKMDALLDGCTESKQTEASLVKGEA